MTETELAMLNFELHQAQEKGREDRGREWSEAHPLPNGIRFSWPYGYDIGRTHYHLNPVICTNCSYKTEAWAPKGTKRPDRIKNPWPCVNCGVTCDMSVGRWS